MTAEELKKQKEEKQAADKASYMTLAAWHDSEAARYRKKADECSPAELVSAAPAGSFGGL
jgi:hypothetical protein